MTKETENYVQRELVKLKSEMRIVTDRLEKIEVKLKAADEASAPLLAAARSGNPMEIFRALKGL